jgi:hypothetical protein
LKKLLSDILESNFKRSSNDEILFFKWGVLAKGYILRDEAHKEAVKELIATYYVRLFIVMLFFSFSIFAPLIIIPSFALLIGFLSFFFIQDINKLLKDCPKSQESMSLNETLNKTARHLSLTFIYVAIAFLTLCIVALLYIATLLPKEATPPIIILVLIIATSLFVYVRMVVVKKQLKPQKASKGLIVALSVLLISLITFQYQNIVEENKAILKKYQSIPLDEFAAFLAQKNPSATAKNHQVIFSRKIYTTQEQLQNDICSRALLELFIARGGVFVYNESNLSITQCP